MRLNINHRSDYRFSVAQARVVQLLHATPRDHAGQTVVDWSIDVDVDARLRTATDGFGNITTMLYVDGPIDRLGITVRGEVLTSDEGGIVSGTIEPLPPVYFSRATLMTQADEAIAALAMSVSPGDPRERALALNRLVASAIKIDGGRTAAVPASEVLARGQGSVRDAARLGVAIALCAGVPARMVAGHAALGDDRRQSAHYWLELFVAGVGWIGLDPSASAGIDDRYVRVAVGRDGSDVAPVAGARRGGGVEELDVAVHVGAAQS